MRLRHIIAAQVPFPPASPQTGLSAGVALTLGSLSPHRPCHPPALSTCFWMLGNYRTLFGNKIKSVAKRAFSGLEGLEHL